MSNQNKKIKAMALLNSPVSNFIHIVCLVAFTIILLTIFHKINAIQPIPYLDEIYHIPQSQEYCKGNFTYWDHRITTLPGLYLISVGIIRPLSDLLHVDLCSLTNLRFTNILLSVFNLTLYVWLNAKIHHLTGSNKWKGLLSAVNIALFPPLFFFAFLYYTDVAAAFLVLLMFSLHYDGRYYSAALAGVGSVLMRQTNIIWTFLVAVKCLDESIQHLLLSSKDCRREMLSSRHYIKVILEAFLKLNPVSHKVKMLFQLFISLLPYAIVGILFLLFVFINDGLVVGDREAHQPSINIPQIFYFFGVVTFFSAPHWLAHIKPFIRTCLKKWYWVLLATIISGFIIRYNTLVHPYLLADNRHYTFYIWKRVFENNLAGRYLMIPVYFFGAYVTYRTMIKTSFLFTCSFFVCCILVLVPQRLLEIRYFFIPYLITRLHITPRSWMPLILEFFMFLSLNAATLYLFVNRPFYWSDSPLVQRFMW